MLISHGLRNSYIISRPQNFNALAAQKEIVASFKGMKESGSIPHCLLFGPPGCGKTSLSISFAKELFGAENYKHRVLELNASDDRGIQKVREKIKTFAERQTKKIPGINSNLKIVILDEADHMTKDAQNAMRRIIEDYSKTTRFFILCNYVTKIIDPIVSRCSIYKFKGVDEEDQILKIKEILNKENFYLEDEYINMIIKSNEGDMRKGINYLQIICNLKKSNKGILIVENVEDILGVINEDIVFKLMRELEGYDIKEIENNVNYLLEEGYNCDNIIDSIYKYLKSDNNLLNDIQNAYINNILIDYSYKVENGAEAYLALCSLLLEIKEIIITKK